MSIRDVFYPTFEEAAHMMGFSVEIKVGVKEIHVYRNGFYYGTVICRSMDNPSSIVGFKIAMALVDEIDVLAMDKAKQAWIKIVGRLRLVIDGVVNGIAVTTTPEGFLFVYSRFKEDPTESYSMVQSSTHENAAHLPSDYIPSLIETYTEELAMAYVGGQFVNLKSGTVYRGFNRKHCSTEVTLQQGEQCFIGQDFNVYNMASVVYLVRDGVWHAVDELKKLQDTPTMLKTVKERFPTNNPIFYPDSSGKNKSSRQASESDIRLIQAEHSCRYKKANPLVKDRVLSMNMGFTKGKIKVNIDKCPEFTKCLEQQVYDDNGAPDKKSGFDHMNDAGGYPIAYELPVNKPLIIPTAVSGL